MKLQTVLAFLAAIVSLAAAGPCSCGLAVSSPSAFVQTKSAALKADGTAYIQADTAQLESLTACYCGRNEPVQWSLVLDPAVWKTSQTICQKVTLEGITGASWSVNEKLTQKAGTIGGNVVLKWKDSKGISGSVSFKIRGKQPSKTNVIAEVKKVSSLWYLPYVATHESGPNGPRQFESETSGIPLRSFDNGFGIFQLTNPVPKCNQVWSWKENVKEGAARFAKFQTSAKTWMDRQRSQAKAEAKDKSKIPVPEVVEANCRFKDGTARTIEDAVALKMFNGASGGNYCSWDNAKASWKFNPKNNLGFNYVNRVCTEVPK